MTSGAMRFLDSAVTAKESMADRATSGGAVLTAPRKADIELLQLAVEVGAFEPRLLGNLAHVALLAAEQLLEIDALERLARLAQRQLEELLGNFRGKAAARDGGLAQQALDV